MDRSRCIYVALGDSFTIGTGISRDEAFPNVLVRRWAARGIVVDLTNPSVNGFTTDDLIHSELPLLARVRPTLVTVLIGANDLVRGSDETRYRSQLRHIHSAIRAQPVEAVFALPQPDWSLSPAGASFGDPRDIARAIERFNEVAREEAEHAGARYVDLFPLMREQAQRRMFAPDGLHPSAEAHAAWAERLEEAITPVLRPG